MNRAKKYFMNAVLLSLVTIIMRAVSVSFNAYVTQKIGSEAVGLFTLVMSVYALAVTLATSGVNLAAVRMTADTLATCHSLSYNERELKRALRREMAGCLKYSTFFGLFASLLLFILSDVIGTYLLSDTRTIMSLKALSPALMPISLTSALAGYFTGLRKVYKNAVISVLEQIVKITVTAAALMVIAPRGIEYACLAVVGGSAVSEGASLIISIVLYLFDQNKAEGKKECFDQLKKTALIRAFEIAFPTAMGAYVRQGLLCAEHIAIPAGLRRYGSGAKGALASYGTLHAMAFPLIFFPSSVIGAFSSLLIPELTECATLNKRAQVQRIAEKVVRFCLLFSIGCAGVFLAFGRDLGKTVYSSSDAGNFICALAPLVPIMYLDTAVDSVLKGLGKQLYCMKVNIIDSFLSLVLVLILVPRLGTRGYVICVYVAELVNFTLSFLKMAKESSIRFSPRWVITPALSILVTTTLVKLLCSNYPIFDETFLKIIITALIYSALIIPKCVFFKQKSYKREKASITP